MLVLVHHPKKCIQLLHFLSNGLLRSTTKRLDVSPLAVTGEKSLFLDRYRTSIVQRASEADSQSCSIEISDVIVTSGVLEHKWRASFKLHYC